MEYVKRLLKKEATESGEPKYGEELDQTALRTVKQALGLWQSKRSPIREVGQGNW
jgi:hypothetical protein